MRKSIVRNQNYLDLLVLMFQKYIEVLECFLLIYLDGSLAIIMSISILYRWRVLFEGIRYIAEGEGNSSDNSDGNIINDDSSNYYFSSRFVVFIVI